jgi:hypothetical protein
MRASNRSRMLRPTFAFSRFREATADTMQSESGDAIAMAVLEDIPATPRIPTRSCELLLAIVRVVTITVLMLLLLMLDVEVGTPQSKHPFY